MFLQFASRRRRSRGRWAFDARDGGLVHVSRGVNGGTSTPGAHTAAPRFQNPVTRLKTKKRRNALRVDARTIFASPARPTRSTGTDASVTIRLRSVPAAAGA